MKMSRELLFKVTKNDFVIETFRCGGKGGQNVNKVETGVRIRHPASGAVAEGREHRTQLANRKSAFSKLIERDEFKHWHKLMCAKCLGKFINISEEVDRAMDDKNLKVEVMVDGKWKEIKLQDVSYEEVFEDEPKKSRKKDKKRNEGLE
jgi:hypothetical protein